MKIGIMSMQRIINYGSFLQAYGLKKTIESLGHEVDFVDYSIGEPLVGSNSESAPKTCKLLRLAKVVFSRDYREKRNVQLCENRAFAAFSSAFRNEWLPWLGISDTRNLRPELDVLVIGSDEVFNCTQKNPYVGYSLELFGKNHNAKKLLSYAASFGSTTLEKLNEYNKTEEIAECLRKFDAVSVRDNNSHSLVKHLTGAEPTDNVDPVLIYNFDKEVRDRKADLKDYIIVYAYSGRINADEAKAIQAFARKHNKRTLSIGVRQSFTDEYVCVDPFTMLAYFKNADFVVTDTFHGTVFSIKYQIPFATIIRDSNKEKLSDLLSKFNLTDRRVNDISDLESILSKELDAELLKKMLLEYSKDAVDYLKSNIE
ncbi:MAG: polysaccharide pyruvyl transferase family protein [Eubacteriales bacterium]|nr:polysaccharide pyruvyl transferase family protein [Eubacteriales bacterium]